jgi:hypothetical protein
MFRLERRYCYHYLLERMWTAIAIAFSSPGLALSLVVEERYRHRQRSVRCSVQELYPHPYQDLRLRGW